jgi:hypothetical protein
MRAAEVEREDRADLAPINPLELRQEFPLMRCEVVCAGAEIFAREVGKSGRWLLFVQRSPSKTMKSATSGKAKAQARMTMAMADLVTVRPPPAMGCGRPG